MIKVLYFTAGDNATAPELAEIAAIPSVNVQVRNGAANAAYGTDTSDDPRLEACDFVAGTIPAAYAELPEYSAGAALLASTEAVVSDEQVINIDGGGTVTLTIVDNAITSAVYAAP